MARVSRRLSSSFLRRQRRWMISTCRNMGSGTYALGPLEGTAASMPSPPTPSSTVGSSASAPSASRSGARWGAYATLIAITARVIACCRCHASSCFQLSPCAAAARPAPGRDDCSANGAAAEEPGPVIGAISTPVVGGRAAAAAAARAARRRRGLPGGVLPVPPPGGWGGGGGALTAEPSPCWSCARRASETPPSAPIACARASIRLARLGRVGRPSAGGGGCGTPACGAAIGGGGGAKLSLLMPAMVPRMRRRGLAAPPGGACGSKPPGGGGGVGIEGGMGAPSRGYAWETIVGGTGKACGLKSSRGSVRAVCLSRRWGLDGRRPALAGAGKAGVTSIGPMPVRLAASILALTRSDISRCLAASAARSFSCAFMRNTCSRRR